MMPKSKMKNFKTLAEVANVECRTTFLISCDEQKDGKELLQERIIIYKVANGIALLLKFLLTRTHKYPQYIHVISAFPTSMPYGSDNSFF